MEQRAANLVTQGAEPVLKLLKTIVLSLHEVHAVRGNENRSVFLMTSPPPTQPTSPNP